MWLNSFKIAIIEKDTDKLDKLMGSMPQLENIKEMEEAIYLIEEAKNLVHTLKDETALSMKRLKKHIDFLKSTQTSTKNRLDIKL